MIRELISEGAEQALADYMRFSDAIMGDIAEPSLVPGGGLDKDHPRPRAGRCGCVGCTTSPRVGSAGRTSSSIGATSSRTQGDDPNSPAVFVAHDFTHVIAGYERTGPGRASPSVRFRVYAMNDSDTHWVAFLGSLAIHEAGYFNANSFEGRAATLMRPGAIETPVAETLARGWPSSADFTAVEHLGMADRPLADIRAEYGIPPVVLNGVTVCG